MFGLGKAYPPHNISAEVHKGSAGQEKQLLVNGTKTTFTSPFCPPKTDSFRFPVRVIRLQGQGRQSYRAFQQCRQSFLPMELPKLSIIIFSLFSAEGINQSLQIKHTCLYHDDISFSSVRRGHTYRLNDNKQYHREHRQNAHTIRALLKR